MAITTTIIIRKDSRGRWFGEKGKCIIRTIIVLAALMIVAASNVTQEAKSTANQTREQMQSGMANVSQGAEKTVNQTKTAVSNTAQGVPGAINQTGRFLGNVSETIAENPVVTNITG